MNSQRRLIVIAAIAGCLMLLIALPSAQPTQAAPSSGYEVAWWTIDGGGVLNSTGGAYSLSGTIGQPDAGASSGGSYTQSGGFWIGDLVQLYLPLILR